MKSGRAALYANRILRKEALDDLPAFFQWRDFERDFVSKFCQKDEVTAALTKLESTRYYQGRKSMDDYTDEFSELIDEAIHGWPGHCDEIPEGFKPGHSEMGVKAPMQVWWP